MGDAASERAKELRDQQHEQLLVRSIFYETTGRPGIENTRRQTRRKHSSNKSRGTHSLPNLPSATTANLGPRNTLSGTRREDIDPQGKNFPNVKNSIADRVAWESSGDDVTANKFSALLEHEISRDSIDAAESGGDDDDDVQINYVQQMGESLPANLSNLPVLTLRVAQPGLTRKSNSKLYKSLKRASLC